MFKTLLNLADKEGLELCSVADLKKFADRSITEKGKLCLMK